LAFKNYYQSQKVGLKILFILKVVSFENIFQVKIVIGDAKVHTFLIQCFEWLLIATICGYFQLFISSNYPKIVLNEDCEKLCFKNEWTLVGSIFWKSSAGSDMNSNSHSVTLSIELFSCGRSECAKLARNVLLGLIIICVRDGILLSKLF
jgi:hypothetical protein